MKKLLIITILLLSTISFSQKPEKEIIKETRDEWILRIKKLAKKNREKFIKNKESIKFLKDYKYNLKEINCFLNR